MIALIEGEIVRENGILTFELTDSVELDLIVTDPRFDGETSMFVSGSTIEGYPARVQVTESKGSQFLNLGTIEGVLVETEKGAYIVPFDYVKEVESKFIQPRPNGMVEDLASEENLQSLENKLNSKTILGFNYKQLLLIAGLTFIVVKIAKN
jgi:hypothetical protein